MTTVHLKELFLLGLTDDELLWAFDKTLMNYENVERMELITNALKHIVEVLTKTKSPCSFLVSDAIFRILLWKDLPLEGAIYFRAFLQECHCRGRIYANLWCTGEPLRCLLQALNSITTANGWNIPGVRSLILTIVVLLYRDVDPEEKQFAQHKQWTFLETFIGGPEQYKLLKQTLETACKMLITLIEGHYTATHVDVIDDEDRRAMVKSEADAWPSQPLKDKWQLLRLLVWLFVRVLLVRNNWIEDEEKQQSFFAIHKQKQKNKQSQLDDVPIDIERFLVQRMARVSPEDDLFLVWWHNQPHPTSIREALLKHYYHHTFDLIPQVPFAT